MKGQVTQDTSPHQEAAYSDLSQATMPNSDEVFNIRAMHDNDQELYRVRASRLVEFFPGELVIHAKTISVIRRQLMASKTETIYIRDIGRVIYIDTPIFASLEILGKNTAHDLCIKGLRKDEARKAREIINRLLLKDQGKTDGMPDWIEGERQRGLLQDEVNRQLDYREDARKKR